MTVVPAGITRYKPDAPISRKAALRASRMLTPERNAFFIPFNILYYELLNFNPLGSAKREALDARDDFADTKPMANQKLEELKAALQDIDIKVKIS